MLSYLQGILSGLFTTAGIVSVVIVIFGVLVPLAILAGRYAVKNQRQRVLLSLARD